jgi:hypothetical protein
LTKEKSKKDKDDVDDQGAMTFGRDFASKVETSIEIEKPVF